MEGPWMGHGWVARGSQAQLRERAPKHLQGAGGGGGGHGWGRGRARPSATWSMRAEESAVRIERAEVVISGVSAAAAAVAAHREVIDSSTSTQRKGCRLSNCERATCG